MWTVVRVDSKDWLRIRIMCLSGVACLHVDSCKCKRLAQNQNNVSEWSVYMWTVVNQNHVSEPDSCKSKDWLRIRIMCLSGVTCLHVDSCKSKEWLRIRIMCLSGVTCLHVEVQKCLSGVLRIKD